MFLAVQVICNDYNVMYICFLSEFYYYLTVYMILPVILLIIFCHDGKQAVCQEDSRQDVISLLVLPTSAYTR